MINKIRTYLSDPQHRKLLPFFIIIAVVVTLPLIVVASLNQQTIRQRASELVSSPFPISPPFPDKNPISWKTDHVSLQADDFYIIANGKKYLGNAGVNLNSDPPDSPKFDTTTLEAIWNENGVEMRMFIYFQQQNGKWNVYEVRTYNGNSPGDWLYYNYLELGTNTNIGSAFTKPTLDLPQIAPNAGSTIHFTNIKLQPFLTIAGSSNRVFVTSTNYTGNLGGLTGADAKCQERASAANLGGTWKAWISTFKIPASSRLNHSSNPYKLINGTVIADNWDELTRGSGLKNPINISELGNKVEGWVWTDTDENGNQAEYSDPVAFRRAMDCKEWTSSEANNNTAWGGFGISSSIDYRWTKASQHDCSLTQALYCFEQSSVSVTPTPTPSAILSATPATVTTKGTLTVNWSGITNPNLGDFMNFMTADGKNGIASHTYWIHNNCTWFTPTSGTPKASGSCTIDLSKEIFNLSVPGPYSLILYSGATPGASTVIAKSNDLTIVNSSPTPGQCSELSWNKVDWKNNNEIDWLTYRNAPGSWTTLSSPPQRPSRANSSGDRWLEANPRQTIPSEYPVTCAASTPTPTPTQGVCNRNSADINKDGKVTDLDSQRVSSCFGQRSPFTGSCLGADTNKDGKVDQIDMNCVLRNFDKTSSPTPFSTPTPKPTNKPTPTNSPTVKPSLGSTKRVFVTSTTYNGNLGGLSGADAKCQERANVARLSGAWKAWLSDSITSAASRLTHSNGQYQELDGNRIANNWNDLVDSSIQNAIDITEFRTRLGLGTTVWTNTLFDGRIRSQGDTSTCHSWTSNSSQEYGTVGGSWAFDYRWTHNLYDTKCNENLPLYCFEQ